MLSRLSGRFSGLLLALTLLSFPVPAWCAQTTAPEPTLTARESTFDLVTKEFVARGDARLTDGDLLLTADEIRYNQQTRTAAAKGHLVLTRSDRRLVADEGSYNLENDTLHVRHVRFGRFPFYITGDTVDGTMENLVVTNANVFFREEAAYAPSIRADKLVYQQGRIVSGDNIKLGLLGGHFIALPAFTHDLHSELLSQLTAHVGYRSSLGAIGEFGMQLPVAPGLKLGADAGLYTARGLMIGPAASYASRGDDSSVHGFLRSGYIHDYGDRLTDILGDPIPKDRSFLEWQHQQQIGGHFTLDGQLNYWSDSEVLRDFKPDWYFPVQQPDSFLEGAYTGNDYVFSAFLRANPNHFFLMQQRLPELRFDLLPSPVALGVYERLNASFAVLDENAYLTSPGVRSDRLDAYYGLERPLALTPWLTFTPVAGGRVTYYADAVGGKSTYTRTLGEVGFDSVLRASGTSDYKNEIWGIDGLRHLLEPKISYRYAPEAAAGQAYIPAIDRQVFTTYLPPLSIGDQRNIDQLDPLNTLRLALNNTLQTRDKTYGSRDLASLNFATDYRFSRQPGQRPLSDFYTEANLTPVPWLRFEAFQRVSTHDATQQELNYAVELIDQDAWSVRLSSHYLRNGSGTSISNPNVVGYEEYLIDYRQRLSDTLHFLGRWRYDARRSRLIEQTYGITQRLGQTWDVRYELSFTRGQLRESSFGFNINLDLLKF